MKIAEIRSKIVQPFKVSTTDCDHNLPVIQNTPDRQLSSTVLNQKWFCALTYIHTDEDFIYLSAVRETFS